MLPVLLVVLLTVALGHGLLEPLVHLLTPVLELGWLGWLLAVLIAWVFTAG